MIDRLDLESLYGGKPREEDNTNLIVIEAYLQLIATASRSKGLNIETLGWEAFEKGFGNKPMKDLLKGKALLTEQDAVLVPCNPGLSKHWFLLVVLPKEKRVLVLDSKAGSFTKPSAENATAKMWKLLQQVDSSLDVKHWCFLANAPKDIPQQENNIDCGVFLCMFARCLLLQSPAPGSTTINNLRRHMIVELHQQEQQSFYIQSLLSRQTHIMLLSTRRHTTLAEPWEVLMVQISLISSSCTPQFLVEQKCLTGQGVMTLTGSTVQMSFMDLLLLLVLALLLYHNWGKLNKCTSG